MKLIITESQYKKLTEEHSGDIKSYLEEIYPNISNLKMRFSKGMKGVVRKYYDPETDKVLFYTNRTPEKGWESNIGAVDKNPYVRLFVEISVYRYVKKFSFNFEDDLLVWFNSTYDENANSVIKSANKL
jgi:hypothetical protein